MNKTCSKCSICKDISFFYKDKYQKDGFYPSCKPCKNTQDKESRLKNIEENLKRHREYHEKNKEIRNKKRAELYHSTKKLKNRPKRDAEFYKNYYKEYHIKHREKRIARNVRRAKERRHTDPIFKLSINLRSRLNKAVRHNYKAGSVVRDLGCSIPEFKLYLESKFKEGMSWDNYGRTGWHIDHIIPLSKFDLTNREHIKIALHYTNLQPLWARENISKGNR